jgi:hypothetical protein
MRRTTSHFRRIGQGSSSCRRQCDARGSVAREAVGPAATRASRLESALGSLALADIFPGSVIHELVDHAAAPQRPIDATGPGCEEDVDGRRPDHDRRAVAADRRIGRRVGREPIARTVARPDSSTSRCGSHDSRGSGFASSTKRRASRAADRGRRPSRLARSIPRAACGTWPRPTRGSPSSKGKWTWECLRRRNPHPNVNARRMSTVSCGKSLARRRFTSPP